MRRDPAALADTAFDVLVVGGGIHGACVARDAALRGLSVALIDRGDFGCGTSHNSFKLLHGGVRYVQHFDLGRMRQSLGDRRAWLRTAPHLTRVLRFVTPTHGMSTRSKAAFRAAFLIHELVGFDRNSGVGSAHKVPGASVIGRSEALRALPWEANSGLTGAAIWFDGQMEDANRLLLECVIDAVEHGAEAANYVQASSLLHLNGRVVGVRARDVLSGRDFEIRAAATVNAAGPWAAGLLGTLGSESVPRRALIKNMNLVVGRRLADHGVGFYSTRESDGLVGNAARLYFVTPWAGVSIIGTTHFEFHGSPADSLFTEQDVNEFIDEVSAALPELDLSINDVLYCHAGLTPAESGDGRAAGRARRSAITDHAASGAGGLITVEGVKFTTARAVAQAAVDLIAGRAGKAVRPCSTASARLPGARDLESLEDLVRQTEAHVGAEGSTDLGQTELERLAMSYGCRVLSVLSEGTRAPGEAPSVLCRRVRYAVRREMAVRLQDVLLRRMDVAERGALSRGDLEECAGVMAVELGWPQQRLDDEIADASRQLLRRFGRLSDTDRR